MRRGEVYSLNPANDNYDKSTETLETYDDVAIALVEHLSDFFGLGDGPSVEESINSVISRTNSISALEELTKRMQKFSILNSTSAYMRDLIGPKEVGDVTAPYIEVTLAECMKGVVSTVLRQVLVEHNPSSPPMHVAKQRVSSHNYLDPHTMKGAVITFKDWIIKYLEHVERQKDIPKKIHDAATKRIALLRKTQE